MKYFSYDYEDGIEFHDTEDDAIRRAEAALDRERSYADEGWEPDVVNISYGTVTAKCKDVATESGIQKGIDYQLAKEVD